ncbi:MAG: MgtC/SapB family protein, partial [Phycisphaerae bacterium]|nr:MgtC/SapB family protein [Phycisphaerae bacterium]
IWVLAAIGAVIGLGFPWLGVKLAILTVIVLVGVDMLENQFESMQRGVHRKSPSPHGTAEGPRVRSPHDSE